MSAADSKTAAPVPEPVIPAPVAAAPDWTGFYVGADIGLARGASGTAITRDSSPGPPAWTADPRVRGTLGSLRLGYDMQMDDFVVGALLEAGLGTASASQVRPGDDGPPAEPRARYSNLMSAALRAGALVNDGDTLLYGRLGVSRARIAIDNVAEDGPWTELSGRANGTGLNLGLGAEHRMGGGATVFAEYNYHGVGRNFTVERPSGPPPDWDVRGKALHVFQVGVNFRF
ncbi:MAG: porin family protein [Rhodobacteraceae bacterium]|nr:porin family protein [Paracoccaceae bacterium]